MAKRTYIFNSQSGLEALRAVDFSSSPVGYVKNDVTNQWITPANAGISRTIEMYIRRHDVTTDNKYIYHMANVDGGATNFFVSYFNGTGILFGHFRTGGFFYRRRYPFPQDLDWHHVIFTFKTTGGATREACYIDGVAQVSNSSAYICSNIIVPGTQWLKIGERLNNTFPIKSDLAYLAFYDNLYLPTTLLSEPYYNLRLNLNARRNSGANLGINKPELFFSANDIVDLSDDWPDSNLGMVLDSTNLDNSDIILV